MRRFSLQRVRDATGRTVRRFPLALLAAVVTGVSAVISVEATEYGWRNATMSGVLGIPLFLVLALVAERREVWRLPGFVVPVASVMGAGLLVVYGLALPSHLRDTDVILFLQLAVGVHLLVAVLPFAGRGEIRGMWQFNLALVLRFLTAAFFTAVLFGGLSLALAALDTLLGVDIDDDLYLQLWFLTCFVFNSAYFLGGVPERVAVLDRVDAQPKVVRVFAQYILAPLVVVYLAILLAYLVKVVATAEWPSGWIGYLVSSVAVAGILSLLLLKLEFERPDRRWVRVYARLFHVLMVPAVVMLALAIFKRIGQYGVTEMRYFLAVLTVWLAVVVAVGCWRRHLLFKAIPASLAVVAFLTAIGPWSAFGIAHRSQLARLEGLLAAQSRFDGAVVVPAETEVSPRDGREISGSLFYLFDHFGADALGDRADEGLQARLAEEAAQAGDGPLPAESLASTTAAYLNLEYTRGWRPQQAGHYAFRRTRLEDALSVRDWDYLVSFHLASGEEVTVVVAADSCRLSVDWPAETLRITRGPEPLVTVPMTEMLTRLRRHGGHAGGNTTPDSLLQLTSASTTARALLRVDGITWTEDADGGVENGTLDADLLIALPHDRSERRE